MAGFGQRIDIRNVKVRALFDGTSGSGKTVSSIRFAYGLAERGAVGAICSEGGRINHYAMRFPDLMVEVLSGNYAPDEYIKLIEKAEQAGLDALVIDGVSHEWQGRGGIMEMLDTLGNRNGSPWKTLTPLHRKFTEKILTSRIHIIMTCRTDTEWVYETQQRGDRRITVPRKVGMKLQQRPGFEYDVDLWFRLDDEHRAWVQKTNFDAVFPSRVDLSMIEESHGEALRNWLASVTPEQAEQIEQARTEDRRQAERVDARSDTSDIMHEMLDATSDSHNETPPPDASNAPDRVNGHGETYETCVAHPKGGDPCGARLYPTATEEYDGKVYRASLIIEASKSEFQRVLCGAHLYQARKFRQQQQAKAPA